MHLAALNNVKEQLVLEYIFPLHFPHAFSPCILYRHSALRDAAAFVSTASESPFLVSFAVLAAVCAVLVAVTACVIAAASCLGGKKRAKGFGVRLQDGP